MTYSPNSRQGGRTPDAITSKQAVGVAHGHYTQITTRFDTETWAALRLRACSEKTSVAEQVRLLVEWGLESTNA